MPTRCSGRYVPGTRLVVVEHDNGGDERMQLSLLDLSHPLGRPAGLDDLQPLVVDPAHMHDLRDVTQTSSLVYSTNRRNDVDMDVVVRDVATGQERVVYDAGGYIAEAVASHDGRSAVGNRLGPLPNSTVVEVARAAAGDAIRMLTNRDDHAHHDGLAWAAGDDAILMSSNHDSEFTAVVRLSLDGHWRMIVEDPAHDLMCWASPDGRALVVGTLADGAVSLAVHEATGAKRGDVELPADGMTDVTWTADGSQFLVSISSPTDPGSLHRVDAATGATTVVVDGREAIPPALRNRSTPPTVHRVPTPDGEQVPCFVTQPHRRVTQRSRGPRSYTCTADPRRPPTESSTRYCTR